MWRPVLLLLALSAALFGALTLWTNHTTAAAHARSHTFAQAAKALCEHAPRTAAAVERAAEQLAALPEPPNVHRAAARLELHWRRIAALLHSGAKPSSKGYRSELKQARLSAQLLNISACESIAPK